VKKTGGDLNKITYREVPLPSMLDALKNRQVDVALLLDPFMSIAFADPTFELVGWPSSIVLPNLPSSLWIVSGTLADTKPELVRGYLRGYLKGVAWVNANLGNQAYLELVASYTKTDPRQLAKMYTAGQLTEINVDAIKGLLSVMKEYDLLKTDVEIESKIFKATA
jgi:NitT/TauT family transport system substrate-binding protein